MALVEKTSFKAACALQSITLATPQGRCACGSTGNTQAAHTTQSVSEKP